MSTKANYFKIGMFVMITIALVVGGTILFSARQFIRDVFYIETYVDQSVQGLNAGSPLMQRGVEIGRVEKITFANLEYPTEDTGTLSQDSDSSSSYRYVIVIMSVNRSNFPHVEDEQALRLLIDGEVKQGLRLKITTQGLTGLSYVEADYLDPQRHPPIEYPWEPKHIYIPWAPGTLKSFEQSVDTILRNVEKVDFEHLSESLDQVLVTIHDEVKKVHLSELIEELRDTNRKFQAALDKGSTQLDNLPPMITQVNRTLATIENFLKRQESDVEEIIENIRRVSVNLRELSEYSKRYPSQVIFGGPPPRSEVVE